MKRYLHVFIYPQKRGTTLSDICSLASFKSFRIKAIWGESDDRVQWVKEKHILCECEDLRLNSQKQGKN